MKKLTFEEFIKTAENVAEEFNNKYTEYVEDTLEEYEYETKNSSQVLGALWLAVQTPQTEEGWKIAYNSYLNMGD